jgi:DNA modification methylase
MAEPLFWPNRIVESGAANPQELAKGYNELNWRGHPENQRAALEEALDSLGWLSRVIVNKSSGHIIDGHLRVELAVLKGEPLVPVDYVELTDDEEALALATLDAITEQAQPIPEKLAALLERTRHLTTEKLGLSAMLESLKQRAGINGSNEKGKDVQPQENKAAQLAEVWKTQSGQIWILGRHRVIIGDCTDKAVVEAVMRGEQAGLWMVDPPYGIGWKGSNASTLEWEEIDGDKDTKTVGAFFRTLPPEQMAVVWGANCFPELLPHRGRWICWDKRVIENADKMIGSPFELAWMNKTHGFDIIVRVQHGGALNADGGERYHPTQKPVQVYTSILDKNYSDAGIIFDPFSGSGTTLIACENLNRRCRAVEIDKGYAAVTIQRWVDLTGGVPVCKSD